VLEYVIRESGIRWDNFKFTNGNQILAYGDDLCIVVRNQSGIKEILVPLQKSLSNLGLQINREKTKYMVTSKRSARGDDNYESVDHFKYLGSMITTVNDVSVDVIARLAAGNRAFIAIKDLIKFKLLSHKLKIQRYITLIRPVVVFGCADLQRSLKRSLNGNPDGIRK
jgi:hypothetical protein